MLHNRCIFFFFDTFLYWKLDTDLETKWLADLLR